MQESKRRHIAKTLTWRVIASVTTFLIARWFFSEDPNATEKATWVALSEAAVKMFLYYFHERAWYSNNFGLDPKSRKHISKVMSNKNIIPHLHKITVEERRQAIGHSSKVIWFTGLSGSGKSTLAGKLEEELFKKGWHTYLLDGDNIRMGLNKDLAFSLEDRKENIRRIGEVSKLFVDSGLVVLSAFVSPLQEDRDFVRSLFKEGDFVEVFVDCPLEVCEQRDVKGLYAKARKGEVLDFTGISSPFETPKKPEIHINSDEESIEASINKVIKYIERLA